MNIIIFNSSRKGYLEHYISIKDLQLSLLKIKIKKLLKYHLVNLLNLIICVVN